MTTAYESPAMRRTLAVILACALALLAGCSLAAGPTIELVEVPAEAQARTELALLWKVTPPEGFLSLSGTSLHLDELPHAGQTMRDVPPEQSGYATTLYEEPQHLGDGSASVTFILYEPRPTVLYYRFHVAVDGRHYWTPEGALTIVPKPAFTKEFRESHLQETLDALAALG